MNPEQLADSRKPDEDSILRYLRHQMPEEELTEFELYLFENPEFVEEVSLTDAIDQASRKHADQFDAADIGNTSTANLSSRSLSKWLWAAGWNITGAVAAWLFFLAPNTNLSDGQGAFQSVNGSIELFQMRNSTSQNSETIALASSGNLLFSVDPQDLNSPVEVKLFRTDGGMPLFAAQLSIPPSHLLQFVWRLGDEESLAYRLVLTGAENRNIEYQFRVQFP